MLHTNKKYLCSTHVALNLFLLSSKETYFWSPGLKDCRNQSWELNVREFNPSHMEKIRANVHSIYEITFLCSHTLLLLNFKSIYPLNIVHRSSFNLENCRLCIWLCCMGVAFPSAYTLSLSHTVTNCWFSKEVTKELCLKCYKKILYAITMFLIIYH